MGLWDKIRGELVDVVEWTDDGGGALAARFERYNDEIKYGAKLIVRPGQAAVFVDQGKIADVFRPGTHTLETRNLPLLSTLLGWKYGFQSPFKAEVIFVRTTRVTNLKWGTLNPVLRRDPEFGMVRLRAHGSYALQVGEPATFVRALVGTERRFEADAVSEQIRNLVVARFGDLVAESAVALLDLSAHYDELAETLGERLQPSLHEYGLDLRDLAIESISLPPEVERAVDERTRRGLVEDLDDYTRFKTAQAIEAAANNPADGGAGAGMGLGLAFGLSSQVTQPVAAAAGRPATTAAIWFVAVGGHPRGPFDPAGLELQQRSGTLDRDSLVWRQGLPQWAPAHSIPELSALFAPAPPAVPPPLP